MEFIYGTIVGVILSLLIYWIVPRLLRRRSDRRGIQAGDDSLKQLGKGIDTAEKTNREAGRVIDEAKGITGIIDSHNQSATNGVRTAKDILENAKNRQSDS